jgi:NitT/TauT family transport system substrate-binding protein
MPGYHLPLYAGEAHGIWKRHGLDIVLVDPEPGPANAAAVAAGRYDACLTSVAHFVRAKAADRALAAKFVFMVARHAHLTAFVIDGRPAEHGRPIVDFADLEGASFVGSAEETFGREYLVLMDTLGFEPPRTLGLPYNRWWGALAAGEGDVVLDFLDLLPRYQGAADAVGERVRALPFLEAGIDFYGSGLVAGAHLIESRPDVLRRFTAALRDALLATRRDPERAFDTMRESFPGLERERTLAGWRAGSPLVFFEEELGAMEDEKWRRTLEHNAAVQDAPVLELEEAFDPSFVPSPAPA